MYWQDRVQAINDAHAQHWASRTTSGGACGMDDGVDPSRTGPHPQSHRFLGFRRRECRQEPGFNPACGKGDRGENRQMKPLEQAGSVGRGSASCSQPRGGGGLCSIPLLYEEPLGRGGRVRMRVHVLRRLGAPTKR